MLWGWGGALALIAIVAATAIAAISAAAITAVSSVSTIATVFAVATAISGVFAPLSVSWCCHPSCRAQGDDCRDEGFFHVEAPGVRACAILASMTMRADA